MRAKLVIEAIKHLPGKDLSPEELEKFEIERDWYYQCQCDAPTDDDLCTECGIDKTTGIYYCSQCGEEVRDHYCKYCRENVR